jgi:uncharacterized protein (DUF58 family)
VTGPGQLAPATTEARARPLNRLGVAFGWRFLALVAGGLLFLPAALRAPRVLYVMAAWDGLLVVAWAYDAWRLPAPARLTVRRSWLSPTMLSIASRVKLTLVNESTSPLNAAIVDAVPRQLLADPPSVPLRIAPHREAEADYTILPGERGETPVGDAFIHYQSALGLAERWARAPISQSIIVYPNLDDARRESLNVVRGRSREIERRSRRVRGAGRSFESLREHRDGDELRDICWTASARRGKLVTRLYESERSQPIWIVIDSGRLMRARAGALSKLDLAVNAALTLSQVALGAGDRVGLLAYGRAIAHRLPAARGSAHLRRVIDRLALVRGEEAEADHLQAASRLLTDQKQRGLIVWMTDVPDVAMTPDVVTAAQTLMSRHLVLFVMIGQPDLLQLAMRRPANADQMYETAAAQEVVHRRDVLLARLRAQGALAFEARSRFSPALVNAYLDIKRRNRL